MGQLSGAQCLEISQDNYTLIRDVLLVEVSIDNASRAEELNSALKQDDEYVVHVCDQKTFATHRPARIVLSSKLYSWINIFVREARSKVVSFAANPKGTVFLTWFGEQEKSKSPVEASKQLRTVMRGLDQTARPDSLQKYLRYAV